MNEQCNEKASMAMNDGKHDRLRGMLAGLAGSAVLLATLAACGGGGGGDTSTSTNTGSSSGGSTTTPTPTPTPSPTPTSTPTPSPTPSPTPTPTGTPFGEVHSGEGTFYGATGGGHCSFDASPGNLMVAAMNHTDYANSALCGAYAKVTGPKGTVTVRITDECPECKPGDIDLSEQAFPLIADPVAGRVPITWQLVPGDVQGPVQYRYKEGSTRWWTAIQVLNHRLPITKLEILPSGASSWITVPRETYNYFVHPTEIAAGPLQVRITAMGGATLQDTLPEPQEKLVVNGAAQFP